MIHMRLMLCCIVAFSIPALAGTITPGGMCQTATLADYLATGSAGCTTSYGPVLHSFSYSGSLSADDIYVTFIDYLESSRFLISGIMASDGESLELHLSWHADLSATTEQTEYSREIHPYGSPNPSAYPYTLAITTGNEFQSETNTTTPPDGGTGLTWYYDAGWPNDTVTSWDISATTGAEGALYLRLINNYLDPTYGGGGGGTDPAPTPEPGTFALIGAGLVAAFKYRRRLRDC